VTFDTPDIDEAQIEFERCWEELAANLLPIQQKLIRLIAEKFWRLAYLKGKQAAYREVTARLRGDQHGAQPPSSA
jgi:hypothetical protein